jgi:hypothetical protein
MISNYYSHSSMDLLYLLFVSMLIPRAYELAIVSEEERKTREQNKPGEEDEQKGRTTPKLHPETSSCSHLYPCSNQEHTNSARVKEKEEEEKPGRRSTPKQPPRDVYIITRTKNHMAFPRSPCNQFFP